MIGWSPAINRFLQATAIICLVLIVTSHDTMATWQRVGSFPRLVGAGFFFNANRGIITVDGEDADPQSGTPIGPPRIYRTYDGGQNWLPSFVPNGYGAVAFNDLHMTDSLNGWVVFEVPRYGSNIWRTTDGGVSWYEINGTVEEGTSVYETPAGLLYTDRGVRTALNRGLYISQNKGSSFIQLSNTGLNGLDFVDNLHGIASTFNSTTLYTDNGGLSWQQTSQTTEAWGVYGEKGTSNFVIVGEQRSGSTNANSTVARSTDYGLSWNNIATIALRNTGHIEGVGKNIYVQVDFNYLPASGMYRTTDGGFSWKSVGGPSNGRDTRFCVTGCNGAVVYAFDVYGSVYKTMDGGDGLLKEDINSLTFTNKQMSFTADVCTNDNDSTRFINPTCYPLTITAINFSNLSDEAVTSGALSFISKPNLPITLQPGQSAAVRVKWDPVKSSQSLPSSFQFVRFQCISQSGFGTFDTLIPVRATSLGKQVVANFDSSSYSFAPTDFCRYRDTIIHIKNPSCDTMHLTSAVLDNITNWRILTADGQDLPLTLPIVIPPGAQITVKIRFLPTKTGVETGNIAIQLVQRSIIADTVVSMQATTFRSASISTLEMVDFGSISQCITIDTIVAYKNESCEDLVIDWADISPVGAFTIINPPLFPIILKPDSILTLQIHYLPTKNLLENAQLDFHATATGDALMITMFLFGLGTPGTSQYIASIDDSPLVFTPTNFCGIGDTLRFTIKNPGCDSMTIEDVLQTSSSTGVFSYSTSSVIPKVILGGGDSLLVTLFCEPTTIGDHTASIRVRFKLADGSIRDTIYTMSFSVSRGPRTFTVSPASIDYDALALCRERDSVITITNTGCDELTIDSVQLSEAHYNFLPGQTYPIVIPRSGSITIPIRYSSPTPGTYSGDITIFTNADTLPIQTVQLSGNTLDKDYLTLTLENLAIDPNAGDTIKIAVLADRDWIGKGVKDVSFKIRYNTDLLTYFNTTEPPATDMTAKVTQTSPDEGFVEITISSDNEVRFEKGSPLAVVDMITALTDTLYTPLTLYDIRINSGDVYYKDCILAASERSDDFTLYLECGDAPLQNFLSGTPILFVANPTPNPLTQQSGYKLHLPITSSIDGEALLRLVDVNGIERNVYSLGKLTKGMNSILLDLSGYESGIYQYLLTIKGIDVIPVRGKFVIIK